MIEDICLSRNYLQIAILIGGISRIQLPDDFFLHNSTSVACIIASHKLVELKHI